jgi:glycosyltransferase involved in cell wall biosynthesis
MSILNSGKRLLLFICLYSIFPFCTLRGESSFHDVRICVAMLVKDDAAVIEHCLNSVRDIVDCVCICDLGSSDGTLIIIEEYLEKHGIPFSIVHHDWVNLGHNRTIALQMAKKVLTSLNFDLESSYLLILNPEMQLKAAPTFQKNTLTEDAYLLLEQSFPLSYCSYQIHLLRASHFWYSTGSIQNEWSCEKSFHLGKLQTLKIEEPENPLTYAKLESDFASLNKGPHNIHSLFRLAQIHKNFKHFEQAISFFEACLQFENEKEQTWFSKYMIGSCYEEMGQWDRAIYWFLESYQTNPQRAEPLYKLAIYYRLHSKNDLAYLFAKHGSYLSFYENPLFSPLPPLLDYQFDEELSITSYYTPFREEGLIANNHLILRKNVPWFVKDQAYRNLLFYIHGLSDARYQPIAFDLPLIRGDSDERYHPMNPSILKTEDGYRVICRTVNYTQTGAKFFQTNEPSGIFRTRNFLLDYDRHFNLLSQLEITENLPREKYHAFNLEGLDDCRIFNFGNRTCFTCTTMDTSPAGTCQVSLCQLADQNIGKNIAVETLTPLLGPDPYRCEKNWLPFLQDDCLHVVYFYDPFIIYRIDPETGQSNTAQTYVPPLDFSTFRGSASPIPFDGGYLLLIHEVVHLLDYQRCYLHRFLLLDKHLIITHLSKPFYFRHLGIEFCCGMVVDHSGDQLILGVGDEDREALLCFVPIHTVRSMLQPLPIFH